MAIFKNARDLRNALHKKLLGPDGIVERKIKSFTNNMMNRLRSDIKKQHGDSYEIKLVEEKVSFFKNAIHIDPDNVEKAMHYENKTPIWSKYRRHITKVMEIQDKAK